MWRVMNKGRLQVLGPHAELFGNRTQKYWLAIPPELKGTLFFQSANAHQSVTPFTVLKSGVVSIAAANRSNEKQSVVYSKDYVSRE